MRVSLKNCGASNWEPKKSLKFDHVQKTSYFAMRFKDTPKKHVFPKPWSSEFETHGPVELFLILNLKFVTLKHIFNLSSELHGFLPDKIAKNVISRTVGPKLPEKLHFKGWALEESFD